MPPCFTYCLANICCRNSFSLSKHCTRSSSLAFSIRSFTFSSVIMSDTELWFDEQYLSPLPNVNHIRFTCSDLLIRIRSRSVKLLNPLSFFDRFEQSMPTHFAKDNTEQKKKKKIFSWTRVMISSCSTVTLFFFSLF